MKNYLVFASFLFLGLAFPAFADDTDHILIQSVQPADAYDASAEGMVLNPALSLSDAGDVREVRVFISEGFEPGLDTLTCESTASIQCDFNADTGLLTLLGEATAAEFEAVLRQVALVHHPDGASQGIQKRITWQIYRMTNFFAETGHFYEQIRLISGDTRSWENARDQAATRQKRGLQGYLATITSEVENEFIREFIHDSDSASWIGASDAATEGIWRWVTGPEGLEESGEGRQFWLIPESEYDADGNPQSFGAAVNGAYGNWDADEPNNLNDAEHYGVFKSDGTWNDAPKRRTGESTATLYIVEYGGLPGEEAVVFAVTQEVGFASCDDGIQNGQERGVDCGGPLCQACSDYFHVEARSEPIAYYLGQGATVLDPRLEVQSNMPIDAMQVRMAEGYESGLDELACQGNDEISCTFDPRNGSLLLEGLGSAADYQALLRTVTYTYRSGNLRVGVSKEIEIIFGSAYSFTHDGDLHYYELVTSVDLIPWNIARNWASLRRYYGLNGYLATSTSGGENSVIKKAAQARQVWLGGSDESLERSWRWVTGPEGLAENGQGVLFWVSTSNYGSGEAIDDAFVAWGSGEPNNQGEGENYLMLTREGVWNDLFGDAASVEGYVVEYGGMPGDATGALRAVIAVQLESCDDGIQNGAEEGVDCGPSCNNVCPEPIPCTIKRDCELPPVLSNAAEALYVDDPSVDTAIAPQLKLESDGPISGATVVIVEGFEWSVDELDCGELPDKIYCAYDGKVGALRLWGNDTRENYETALQNVVYRSHITTPPSISKKIIQFTIGQDLYYSPTTEHYYEFIKNGFQIAWTDARDSAEALELYGLKGYLATIGSAEENQLLGRIIQGDVHWIGASDEAVEGDWRWVTGPEGLEDDGEGRLFWRSIADELDQPKGKGESIDGNYQNWSESEPNNFDGGEDYASIQDSGTWNDLPNYWGDTLRYVVEYGGFVGEPELGISLSQELRFEGCDDGIQNRDESGIDCGGTHCESCESKGSNGGNDATKPGGTGSDSDDGGCQGGSSQVPLWFILGMLVVIQRRLSRPRVA